MTALVEELTAQRAEERLGERVEVLVEEVATDGVVEGRAAHQAPEVDGSTTVLGARRARAVGSTWSAPRSSAAEGVDLVAAVRVDRSERPREPTTGRPIRATPGRASAVAPGTSPTR